MKPSFVIGDELPTALRVCSWCKKGMGLVPCLPEQAGRITHGVCDACLQRELAALPGPARPTLNVAAAVPAGRFLPGIIPPSQDNGTAAPRRIGDASRAVLEHPSGGPAAAFTFSAGIWGFLDRLIKALGKPGRNR